MVVPYFDQGCKDIVPGLLFHQNFVGEHAAIPANVLKGLGEFAVFIAQPKACMLCNIELSVRIKCLAVSSCFVVRPCAMNGSIVLCYMEINGPWAQCAGQFF